MWGDGTEEIGGGSGPVALHHSQNLVQEDKMGHRECVNP